MLGKFGIFAVILFLVFLFCIVIYLGAGFFSKKEKSPELKKYLKSVNILLALIVLVGGILMFFL